MKVYKIATAMTITTFFISALTGLFIFFGDFGGIKDIHEWMSVMFTVAVLFHIITHKKSFFRYCKEAYSIIIAVTAKRRKIR